MKIKNYERQYERVFTNEEAIRKKVKLELVSVYNNVPGSVEEYINLYRNTFINFQKDIFDYFVKFIWLRRRFCYCNKWRVAFNQNGSVLDKAFGIFVRRYVGFDQRLFFGGYGMFNKLASYVDDFFIDFDKGNPFKEDYKYPYQYITFEYLYVVRKMKERLELLQYGEEQKMSYTEFTDYVLNYICCYNEEHGSTFMMVTSHMPYVRLINSDNKKRFGRK